ncbi:MAG: LCP family protein [Anaerolineae bacterium]|nr:LCP family protein [Anaerolineae bacterium]
MRPATAPRPRSRGRQNPLLAALIVMVGLLALCGMGVVLSPSVLLPGHGSQTNLMLLGIDRREGTSWAYRTDTILIVTVGAGSGMTGILSIPRDLQVEIPGYGQDRINTANVFGYREEDPDAGPALLKATIEGNFSIPIDGYLMIDFDAFVQMVDALGGVDVDVPETLHDTRYPDPRPADPYAFKTVHFDAGWQHMDGARALEYARSRMSTTDFDRAKRQQLILLAIRKKASSARGIARWPSVAAAMMAGIKTDLNAGDLLGLALLAARTDPSNIQQVVVEYPLVTGYERADGAAVQLPNWDLIKPVIEGLFGSR